MLTAASFTPSGWRPAARDPRRCGHRRRHRRRGRTARLLLRPTNRLRRDRGRYPPLPSVDEAEAFPYSDADRAAIRRNRSKLFAGSPSTVTQKLQPLIAAGQPDELMIITAVYDHDARKKSYSLLATFGLGNQARRRRDRCGGSASTAGHLSTVMPGLVPGHPHSQPRRRKAWMAATPASQNTYQATNTPSHRHSGLSGHPLQTVPMARPLRYILTNPPEPHCCRHDPKQHVRRQVFEHRSNTSTASPGRHRPELVYLEQYDDIRTPSSASTTSSTGHAPGRSARSWPTIRSGTTSIRSSRSKGISG